MSLALCDVHSSRLEESATSAREFSESGHLVTTHLVDVGDSTQVESLAKDVLASHGRVTLLINNAGVALHGDFNELSLGDFEWLMRANFWGVVNCAKIFLPILCRETRAHMVNVSSIFGIVAPPGQTAYAASKFAIRGFTEALRHELAESNVGVSCVHPGGIRTRIAEDGRMGSAASGTRETYAAVFSRVARHSPEFAAKKILEGVKRNKRRILIGSEAYALDALERLTPGRIAGAIRTGASTRH